MPVDGNKRLQQEIRKVHEAALLQEQKNRHLRLEVEREGSGRKPFEKTFAAPRGPRPCGRLVEVLARTSNSTSRAGQGTVLERRTRERDLAYEERAEIVGP